ncbi:hypothetical protein [Atopomonas hussainii]|uniref:hypothetical protein n=1 Tax=Atopomonas hussainii TaxID=1429083 RepID=UPI0009001433|nr:hypothetical protein [Atopomonas hussainii]
MKIKTTLLLLAISQLAYAEISIEQERADCLKIKSFAATGDKHYKLKKYSKARKQYEQQAAWSESCQLDVSQIATAYNNVALTYIHEADFLKANAWLEIEPNDKKSIFNASKISKKLKKSIDDLANNPEGQYWQYAGKSLWSTITVKKSDSKYHFNFNGYYAGLMAMYYGPNIGEFSTTLELINGKARYIMSEDDDYFNCTYDFTITDETLTVERISGDSCGFGHNVSAEGVYYKTGT